MVTGDIGTVIDTYEFDDVNCFTPDIIQLLGDVYAIVYRQASEDGWLKTVKINKDGTITEPFIDSFEFDLTCYDPRIIHISGTTYAVVYKGASHDGYIKTFTIENNGQITEPVIDTFSDYLPGHQPYTPDICHVSGNVYAVVYSNGSTGDGYLCTVEIAANGQISGPVLGSLEFVTPYGNTPTIAHVSGTTYVIAYRGYLNDGYVTAVSISDDGATLSTIAQYEFDTADCYDPDILHISGNTFAIAYQGSSYHGIIKTLSVSDSGLVISTLDTFDFVDIAWYCHWIHVDEDIYAVPYRGVDEDGFLKTFTIDTDGQITEPAIDTYEFDTTAAQRSRMVYLGKDKYAIAYERINKGWLVTLGIAHGFKGGSSALPLFAKMLL